MKKERKIHLGAYGIILGKEKLLVIKKNRGPYKGKYDLPGGRIEFGENIEKCVQREIFEETGLTVAQISFLTVEESIFEYFDEKNNQQKEFHHIGVFYLLKIKDENKELNTGYDGHDSDGALYINKNDITSENISPIVYKTIKKLT